MNASARKSIPLPAKERGQPAFLLAGASHCAFLLTISDLSLTDPIVHVSIMVFIVLLHPGFTKKSLLTERQKALKLSMQTNIRHHGFGYQSLRIATFAGCKSIFRLAGFDAVAAFYPCVLPGFAGISGTDQPTILSAYRHR